MSSFTHRLSVRPTKAKNLRITGVIRVAGGGGYREVTIVGRRGFELSPDRSSSERLIDEVPGHGCGTA
jgi:hypothetical protein